MKKILAFLMLLAVPCFAIDSSVIKNTTNGQVFAISYESGSATCVVAGVVVADSFTPTIGLTGGTLTVQTNAIFAASGSTTVTGELHAITVTGTIMPITAGTAVTSATFAAVGSGKVGQLIKVINVGTNAITLLDAAPLYLSANLVLGQRDTVDLYAYATNQLIQTSTSDN